MSEGGDGAPFNGSVDEYSELLFFFLPPLLCAFVIARSIITSHACTETCEKSAECASSVTPSSHSQLVFRQVVL